MTRIKLALLIRVVRSSILLPAMLLAGTKCCGMQGQALVRVVMIRGEGSGPTKARSFLGVVGALEEHPLITKPS